MVMVELARLMGKGLGNGHSQQKWFGDLKQPGELIQLAHGYPTDLFFIFVDLWRPYLRHLVQRMQPCRATVVCWISPLMAAQEHNEVGLR